MNDVEDVREARLDEVALNQFADILRVGKLSINGTCIEWECHGLCKEDQLKNYKQAFRNRLDAPEGMKCKATGKLILLQALEKRVIWFWVMKSTSINFALFEVMMYLHSLLQVEKEACQVVTLETYHRKNGSNLLSYSFNIYENRIEVVMFWKKQADNIFMVNPMTATRAPHGYISEVVTSFPLPLEPVILPTYCVRGRTRRKHHRSSEGTLKYVLSQCCQRTRDHLNESLHIRENLSHLVHLSSTPSIRDVEKRPEPVCDSIPEAAQPEVAPCNESPVAAVREVIVNIPVKRKPQANSPLAVEPSLVGSLASDAPIAVEGLSPLPGGHLGKRWATRAGARKQRHSIECTLPVLLADLCEPFKSGISRSIDGIEPYIGLLSGGSSASNAERPYAVASRQLSLPPESNIRWGTSSGLDSRPLSEREGQGDDIYLTPGRNSPFRSDLLPMESVLEPCPHDESNVVKFSRATRDTMTPLQKLRCTFGTNSALEKRSLTTSMTKGKAKSERSNRDRDALPARSPAPRELTVAAYYDSLAQSGDPTGMLILGQMCFYDVFIGIRIPQRMEKAKWYFKQAMDMGHPDGAYWLEKAEQVVDGRVDIEQEIASDQASTGTAMSIVPWLLRPDDLMRSAS